LESENNTVRIVSKSYAIYYLLRHYKNSSSMYSSQIDAKAIYQEHIVVDQHI
jgi:hypothetical protein